MKAKIIRLDTDKPHLSKNNCEYKDLFIKDGKFYRGNVFALDSKGSHLNSSGLTRFNLYVTTDEQIKEGDWFTTSYDNTKLYRADRINLLPDDKYGDEIFFGGRQTSTQRFFCRKVVASTDLLIKREGGKVSTDIYLPQIPKDFISRYCEQGGIEDVEVEYNWEGERCSLCGLSKESGDCINRKDCVNTYFGGELKLKLSQADNTIFIKEIKNNYSREEMIAFGKKCYDRGVERESGQLSYKETVHPTMDWIEENL